MYCNITEIEKKIKFLQKKAKEKNLKNLLNFLNDTKCFYYFYNTQNNISTTKFVYQVF